MLMAGFDYFGAVSDIFWLSGCVVLHSRLRNRASTALLLCVGTSLIWTWLDMRIPYWNLGPSPIPEPLLNVLFKSSFLMPGVLAFAVSLSFLATVLSIAKRPREAGKGV
jgi:hypothetical protein